ncbi:MAG: hypothetical protein WB579_08770 [Bryobacteraceae bacterium]
MFWSRLGSLNALEEHRLSRFWKQWLGCSHGSGDNLGRMHAGLVAHELREGLHPVYSRLKRNKALPDIGGLGVAVLAGHETHASYRRRCSGCLQRTIHTEQGERIQYYHRNVTLQLLTGSELRLLLDLEPQRPGEDEVATARRLLDRLLARYPASFSCCWPMVPMPRPPSSISCWPTVSTRWWSSRTSGATFTRTPAVCLR